MSPVTTCDPARARGRGQRLRDPAERLEWEALLEDEGGAEEQRPGAAHRKVVDRAVDGERPDVAAAEEERLDDEGIGGEGEAGAACLDLRLVVLPVESRVREQRQEDSRASARRESRPPLPWPSRMRSLTGSGAGQVIMLTSGDLHRAAACSG